MHPLLTRSRLGLFLIAWIALAANSTAYLVVSGRLPWTEAAALAVPLAAIFVFFCLASKYPVKSTPLATTPLRQVALAHLVAAVILSIVWQQMGKGWAYLLFRFGAFPDITRHVAPQLPAFFLAGILIYFLAVAYHYVMFSLEASREAEARVLQSSLLARDAELRALKAQVNPHFLFNSLNSISALTTIDPQRAREMCILLAEFLRMTLRLGEKNSIALEEELGMVERFLAIEKVRFGARLRVEENIQDACKPLLVPALLLQPLVENAVGHGIANLPEGGIVHLSAQASDGRLAITIRNTFDPESTPARRGGMGLANVRKRLEAIYPSQATLQTHAEGQDFCVDILLPAEAREAQP